jgi:hypothetical protein
MPSFSTTRRFSHAAVPFEEDDPDVASLLVETFKRSFRYLGINLVATLLVPGVTRRGEVLEKPAVLEEAVRIGENLG